MEKKRVHNASTGRDYSYDRAYNKRTIEERSARNKARRLMLDKMSDKYGEKRAKQMLKGKDVDHIKTIKDGGKTTKGNIRLLTPSKNRSRKT